MFIKSTDQSYPLAPGVPDAGAPADSGGGGGGGGGYGYGGGGGGGGSGSGYSLPRWFLDSIFWRI